MPVASMTGFARAAGAEGPWRWTVELKCVNAKGLDLRLRLPPLFERIEAEARGRLGRAIARGTCFATVSAQRESAGTIARIDTALMGQIAAAARAAAEANGLAPPTMDGILALRGVVDVTDSVEDEATLAKAAAALLNSVDEAVAALIVARRAEGAALFDVLSAQLGTIARLTAAADANPVRGPEAIRARLAQSISSLMESGRGFDENRLHQEALLLAAKADIREELDRLKTHVVAARALLAEGGSIGRKLDFLAQEFGREANTLCAKANDVTLTQQGLELRVVIEQFREQVQNIE